MLPLLSVCPMQTLIVAPNWIGDLVMAQPLFALLKSNSDEKLTLVAPAPLEDLARVMPELDRVVSTPFLHGKLEWRARTRLARELASDRFDRAFILPNSFKSALIPWLARIPVRIGYRGEARRMLLTHHFPDPAAATPMVERYARLAAPASTRLPSPVLRVAPTRIEEALLKFELDRARPLFIFCPGAEYGPAKRWPPRHFAELAERVVADIPRAQIVILGTANDISAQTEVCAQSRAPIQALAGKTSLQEAIALLAAATGVVCNDSGLMHIAAALGRPQAAIFGSTDPRHTPPRSSRAEVVWLHLECSPCFERVCPLGHLRCLNDIGADQAFSALKTALGS